MKKCKLVSLLLLAAILASSFSGCRSGKWEKIGRAEEPLSLPVFFITTRGGLEIESTEEYLEMTLGVCSAEGGPVLLEALSGRIRGRGNSTWDFCEKKSYRIKLDEKQDLLFAGEEGDKDWALISCAREKSFLRNFAMLYLAKQLKMEAVSDCAFVQVYLNGSYNGLYMLCETVEFGNSRLNLEDEGGELDISYLLELDRRAKSDAESALEYFYVNDWKTPFAIKSHVENEAQTAFIKSYFEETDDAILSGDRERIEALVDLDSFVDMYLLQEFSKNRDVGFASFYLYKPAGERLKCGFPWDFDMALGNDSGEDRLSEEGWPRINYKDPEGLMASVLNRWFEALCQTDWFLALASERWQTAVSPAVYETVIETVKKGYAMEEEAEKNYERWKIMGKKQLFEPIRVVLITSYTGQVDYLADWMIDRKNWLDTYFEELS
jgi:hypothetical protein